MDVDAASAGERLGSYTLVRRLGRGGMGEVWLAEDPRRRPVAIKRILPQYARNPHVVNMLLDEARITGMLRHDNIVRVLELGEAEDQRFLVMEYVEGFALSRLIRRLKKQEQRLSSSDAVFIVLQIAEGLHAAHTQKDERGRPAGIIHRDISPQNVLLTLDGQVKVIDFGIARARDRLEATMGGQVKGKLRYMAPEQVQPSLVDGDPIDHRVDVFAAGIVLYELCAMRQRFGSSGGDLEVIEQIVSDETPDLSADGLIDRTLMDIIDEALEKNRDRRFPDAARLARRLRAWLDKNDPGYTAARLSRVLRRAFGDDDAVPDEKPDEAEIELPAPIVRKGRVNKAGIKRPAVRVVGVNAAGAARDDDDAAGDDADEQTRTRLRPRAAVAPAPAPVVRRKLPIAAIAIGALSVVAVIGLVLGVRTAFAPRALGPDGKPVHADVHVASSSSPGVGPPAAGVPVMPVTSIPSTTALAPPGAAPSGLVDLGGSADLIIEATPPSTRISLAYQPDPRYVSPARLRVQKGATVDLVFEATGYESQRRSIFVDNVVTNVRVDLVAIPVPLIIRATPHDAEVFVDGKLWSGQGGGTVLPDRDVSIVARHPFYLEKSVTAHTVAGEALVVDIKLDDRPAPDAGPAESGAVIVPDPVAPPPPSPSTTKGTPGAPPRAPGGTPKVRTGILYVTSRPTNADVYVDGHLVDGGTPLRMTLPVGPHRVTVRADGGEKTFTADITDGGSVKKEISLE